MVVNVPADSCDATTIEPIQTSWKWREKKTYINCTQRTMTCIVRTTTSAWNSWKAIVEFVALWMCIVYVLEMCQRMSLVWTLYCHYPQFFAFTHTSFSTTLSCASFLFSILFSFCHFFLSFSCFRYLTIPLFTPSTSPSSSPPLSLSLTYARSFPSLLSLSAFNLFSALSLPSSNASASHVYAKRLLYVIMYTFERWFRVMSNNVGNLSTVSSAPLLFTLFAR